MFFTGAIHALVQFFGLLSEEPTKLPINDEEFQETLRNTIDQSFDDFFMKYGIKEHNAQWVTCYWTRESFGEHPNGFIETYGSKLIAEYASEIEGFSDILLHNAILMSMLCWSVELVAFFIKEKSFWKNPTTISGAYCIVDAMTLLSAFIQHQLVRKYVHSNTFGTCVFKNFPIISHRKQSNLGQTRGGW